MGGWQHGQHCQSCVVSSQEEIQKYTTFLERTLLRTKAVTGIILSAQVDQLHAGQKRKCFGFKHPEE